MENHLLDIKPNQQNTVTYYAKDGEVLAVLPIKEGSGHAERLELVKLAGLKKFNHYTIRDTPYSLSFDTVLEELYKHPVSRVGFNGWNIVDLKTGLIVKDEAEIVRLSEAYTP